MGLGVLKGPLTHTGYTDGVNKKTLCLICHTNTAQIFTHTSSLLFLQTKKNVLLFFLRTPRVFKVSEIFREWFSPPPSPQVSKTEQGFESRSPGFQSITLPTTPPNQLDAKSETCSKTYVQSCSYYTPCCSLDPSNELNFNSSECLPQRPGAILTKLQTALNKVSVSRTSRMHWGKSFDMGPSPTLLKNSSQYLFPFSHKKPLKTTRLSGNLKNQGQCF